jgi:hypothetical protein
LQQLLLHVGGGLEVDGVASFDEEAAHSGAGV